MKKRMLFFLILLLAALLCVGCDSGSDDSGQKEEKVKGQTEQAASEDDESQNETGTQVEAGTQAEAETESSQEIEESQSEQKHYTAIIDVKDYGKITVDLDPNAAPITVENFVKLAKDGFYDGLTFHRIMDGFMIQGGDPNGNGTGGAPETIKGEFKNNGYDNPISHVRGTISMARSQDPDSASSQFFIVQTDAIHLDGDYAAFGSVKEGMEIVDKICEDALPVDNNGTIPPDEQPVIQSITIEE